MRNFRSAGRMKTYGTVDDYISDFPADVQNKLRQIRNAIRDTVPDAGEKISYGMPTATLNGKYLVYFAGFKNHVSLYPVSKAVKNSVPDIERYRSGKGTLRFPLDTPLPMPLIRNVITARVAERQKSEP